MKTRIDCLMSLMDYTNFTFSAPTVLLATPFLPARAVGYKLEPFLVCKAVSSSSWSLDPHEFERLGTILHLPQGTVCKCVLNLDQLV